MSDLHHDNNRLELFRAGKLEQRRTPRPPHTPQIETTKVEETVVGFKLRPETVAIALMVVVLLILTVIAL